MIKLLNELRSSITQLLLGVGLAFWLAFSVRKGIREDAFEEAHQQMETIDEAQADLIRSRVDAALASMHDDTSTDTRGYRD